MRFKTTPPTLHEAILMESIGFHIEQKQPDYISILYFIVSRSEEDITAEDLLNVTLDKVLELFADAMKAAMDGKKAQDFQPKPHNNNIDEVALTEDEKARLRGIQERMRERNA